MQAVGAVEGKIEVEVSQPTPHNSPPLPWLRPSMFSCGGKGSQEVTNQLPGASLIWLL